MYAEQFVFVLIVVVFAVTANPLQFYPWRVRRPYYGEEIRRQEISRPSVSQGHLGFGGIIFG